MDINRVSLRRFHEEHFVAVDPLAHKFPGWSSYSYAFCNPIRFTDPTGMAPEDGDPLKKMEIRDNRASNLQGMVRNNGDKPHQGFDLKAAPGTDIMAVKDATVRKIVRDEKAAYGLQILLEIPGANGKSTFAQYSHLSEISVKLGEAVKEGVVIGKTGMTGNADNLPLDQAHLHFEYRSEPSPGLGLGGRLNPNAVLDTKFYSQDPSKNQTNTGVIRVDPTGNATKMDIGGRQTPLKDYIPPKQ